MECQDGICPDENQEWTRRHKQLIDHTKLACSDSSLSTAAVNEAVIGALAAKCINYQDEIKMLKERNEG